jgi:hypothetical protein
MSIATTKSTALLPAGGPQNCLTCFESEAIHYFFSVYC